MGGENVNRETDGDQEERERLHLSIAAVEALGAPSPRRLHQLASAVGEMSRRRLALLCIALLVYCASILTASLFNASSGSGGGGNSGGSNIQNSLAKLAQQSKTFLEIISQLSGSTETTSSSINHLLQQFSTTSPTATTTTTTSSSSSMSTT